MSLGPQDCENLFETLLSLIDKPYDYNHLIAKILCELIDLTTSQNIQHIGGVPMLTDPLRNKLLSVARPSFLFNSFGQVVKNRYLKVGEVPTQSQQGVLITRDATITGISVKSRSTGAWTAEVRKNGGTAAIITQSVSSGEGLNDIIDIDLDAGDHVQMFVNGTASHIIASLEIAWRA
jgi:hypothetical protein